VFSITEQLVDFLFSEPHCLLFFFEVQSKKPAQIDKKYTKKTI